MSDSLTAARQAPLSFLLPGVCSNSCPLNQRCHPAISSSAVPFSSHLQSFPASGSFSSESVSCIRWPKYWSFSFSISPSNEYSGPISFRMDWLDLLAVQGTLNVSSPTPQFKSIHSSALSLLYGPALACGPQVKVLQALDLQSGPGSGKSTCLIACAVPAPASSMPPEAGRSLPQRQPFSRGLLPRNPRLPWWGRRGVSTAGCFSRLLSVFTGPSWLCCLPPLPAVWPLQSSPQPQAGLAEPGPSMNHGGGSDAGSMCLRSERGRKPPAAPGTPLLVT